MAGGKKIIWTPIGFESLMKETENRADYFNDSEEGDKFLHEVVAFAKEKLQYPERFAPCRFKNLQKNGFRCAQFKKNWIIVYREETELVKIYGFGSARRHPSFFDKFIK